MNPALNTTPLSAIPEIERTVKAFGGSLKTSTPNQCRKGIGIHKMMNVKKPKSDVNKFG